MTGAISNIFFNIKRVAGDNGGHVIQVKPEVTQVTVYPVLTTIRRVYWLTRLL